MKMNFKIVTFMVALTFVTLQAILGMDEDPAKPEEDLTIKPTFARELKQNEPHGTQENSLSERLAIIMDTPAGTHIFKHVYFAHDQYFRWGHLKFVCIQWLAIMQSNEIEKFVNFQIFYSSALIFYKEDPGPWGHSNTNFIKMPTLPLMNTKEKTFDVSECGELANGINISLGYRNKQSLESKPGAWLNIWMALGHEIENELKSPPVEVHETCLAEWRANLHIGLYEVDDDWEKYAKARDLMTTQVYVYPWKKNYYRNSWKFPKSLISMLPGKHYKRITTTINNDLVILGYLDQYSLQIKPTYLPLNMSEYTPVRYWIEELIPDEEEAYKEFIERVDPPTESLSSYSPSTSSDDEDDNYPILRVESREHLLI